MKTETSPEPRTAKGPADGSSAQAAVQVALDRRDNGGRAGPQAAGAPGLHRAGPQAAGAPGGHGTGAGRDG